MESSKGMSLLAGRGELMDGYRSTLREIGRVYLCDLPETAKMSEKSAVALRSIASRRVALRRAVKRLP